MKTLKVSNLEAAKRQLDMAIKLFFQYEDVVAIYALTANAHDVLRFWANKKDKKSLIYDVVMESIPEDERKGLKDRIRLAQNGLKHSQGEPIIFSSEQVHFLLFDCCILYYRATGNSTALHHIYKTWFSVNYPKVSVGATHQLVLDTIKTINPKDRETLWSLLPTIEKMHIERSLVKHRVEGTIKPI